MEKKTQLILRLGVLSDCDLKIPKSWGNYDISEFPSFCAQFESNPGGVTQNSAQNIKQAIGDLLLRDYFNQCFFKYLNAFVNNVVSIGSFIYFMTFTRIMFY